MTHKFQGRKHVQRQFRPSKRTSSAMMTARCRHSVGHAGAADPWGWGGDFLIPLVVNRMSDGVWMGSGWIWHPVTAAWPEVLDLRIEL